MKGTVTTFMENLGRDHSKQTPCTLLHHDFSKWFWSCTSSIWLLPTKTGISSNLQIHCHMLTGKWQSSILMMRMNLRWWLSTLFWSKGRKSSNNTQEKMSLSVPFRDKLSSKDGVIMKGTSTVIPQPILGLRL